MITYYCYKYKPDDFKEPEFLGTFETDKDMLVLYDILTQVFGEGFFYRRSLYV